MGSYCSKFTAKIKGGSTVICPRCGKEMNMSVHLYAFQFFHILTCSCTDCSFFIDSRRKGVFSLSAYIYDSEIEAAAPKAMSVA